MTLAWSGDGMGVGRETGEDEMFSCDGVGVGGLVAEAVVGGKKATVGVGATVGVAVGTAAERAHPTTATDTKMCRRSAIMGHF